MLLMWMSQDKGRGKEYRITKITTKMYENSNGLFVFSSSWEGKIRGIGGPIKNYYIYYKNDQLFNKL